MRDSSVVPPRFKGTNSLTCSTRLGSPPVACISVQMNPVIRVDTNSFFGNFSGKADGQCIQGALTGSVIDIFSGRAEPGSRRGYVDDCPAGAAILCETFCPLLHVHGRATSASKHTSA